MELNEAIHTYNSGDFAALIAALQDGTLGKDKDRLSMDKISALRRSKAWKSRFEVYLRKEFHSEETTKRLLQAWIGHWQGQEDTYGCPVFTGRRVHVTREQINKVRFVLDTEGSTSYSPLPPSKNAKHNLTKWVTNRPPRTPSTT